MLGMMDAYPHEVVGSDFAENETGNLEDEIYERLHIRVRTEELHDEKGKRVRGLLLSYSVNLLTRNWHRHWPSALNPHPYIEMDFCSDMRGWGVDYGG